MLSFKRRLLDPGLITRIKPLRIEIDNLSTSRARPAIVARLNAEFVKVLSASDFKAWLMDQGADAAPGTPDELGAFVKAEIARYAPLIRKSGMRPD